MKVNASMVKTWMQCPLQARFKEIEKRESLKNAKASFGTCIHEALELYNNTGDHEAARARFNLTWENPDILGVTPDYWPRFTDFAGLRKKGLEILDKYHDTLKWESREIVATEHKFCVPIGDHHISGVVDLLEVKKTKGGKPALRVVDYKTNSKQPTKDALFMDIQFTTYVYASLQPEFWLGFEDDPKYPPMPNGEALMEHFEGMQRKAIWYHLWQNKEIVVGDRDDDDFMRLYRCITSIVEAIEKEVFVPNISGDSCTWCSFTDLCKVVIPVRDKLLMATDEDTQF
jgi:CRISPR/Cas system-associated exonuclease Cas4 (RecB family)